MRARAGAVAGLALVALLAAACGTTSSASSGAHPARSPGTTSSTERTTRTTTTTTTPRPAPTTGTPAPTATSAPASTSTAAAGTLATGAPGWPSPAAWTALGTCTYSTDAAGDGPLPDPRCTPGAVDPTVSQADIATTICRPGGYTSSVRPPESVTEPQKYASMDTYGDSDGAGSYEFDHLVPLEIGGAPDSPANLWPEPHAGTWGSYTKDRLEDRLHDLVCDGSLPLATAQQAIATDWITAYQQYVGSP